MSDEKTMGQVIQIDEARIRDHLARWFAGRWKRRSMPCWMLRQTSFAAPGVTSAVRLGRIPERAATNGHCILRRRRQS